MPPTACSTSAPSTQLTGRVLDARTSRPAVGVTVIARERDDGQGEVLRRAHTDAKGGFSLTLSEADLRAFATSAGDSSMREATVYLSLWSDEEPLGTQPVSMPTGPVSERLALGDLLVTMPARARTYTLVARVVSASQKPQAGIEVVLETVGLGSREVLATGVTDAAGQHVLRYPGGDGASTRDTDRRLQLSARIQSETLARSPVLFSVAEGETVPLVVSGEPGKGLTELERLQAAIAGPLGAAELAALSLDELEILAQQADVYPPHLALLARASGLSTGTAVTVGELYAMGRDGLPLTRTGLLARDGEAYRRALRRGIVARIIAPPGGSAGAAVDSIAARMADWAGAVAIDPERATPRWANLERSGVTPELRQAFGARWSTLTGSLAERWAAVRADPALSAAAPALEFTAGASFVLGEHGPAVQAVVDVRTSGEVSTLRDLAAWDLERWMDVLAGAGVPEALDGPDPVESTESFARVAMRMVDLLHPGAGLARTLAETTDPSLREVGEFLVERIDFDLERTVLARYAAAHPEVFTDDDAGDARRRAVAMVQRVHALTPAVERPRVTQALLAQGIDSAAAVVPMGRDGFVDRHGEALEGLHPFLGGRALAGAVYEQATVRYGAAVAVASQFGEAFAGASMAAAPAVGWADDPDDPASATLRELFGSQDLCACAQCRSVYGPAAYLVDLLALLESRPAVTHDTALEVLRQRRPDLMALELSCINTNTAVPYIDLVLELLEARVVDPEAAPVARQTTRTAEELRLSPEHRIDAAYAVVANAVHPWGLPFDLSAERVRAYCEPLGASRLEVMQTLRDRTGELPAAAMDRVAESLSITPVTLQLISGATAYDVADLPVVSPAAAWGMTGAGWVATLTDDVEQVLRRSGLEVEALREHLTLPTIAPSAEARVVFGTPSCSLDEARLEGVDEAVLNRLQRFVRLRRATGLAARELDRALRSLGGVMDAATLERLAEAHALARDLSVPLTSLLVLWAELDTHDDNAEPSPYAQRFRSRVRTPQLDPAFALDPSGTELAEVVPLTEAHTPTLRAALSLSDDALQHLVAEVLPSGPMLSLTTISTLARYAQLARVMGVPVAEVVTLRALLGEDPFAAPRQTRAFLDAARAFHEAGLTTAWLDAVARHQVEDEPSFDLRDDAIDATLTTLRTATQAIETSRPEDEQAVLREEALVQTLSVSLGLTSDAVRDLAFDRVHEQGASAQALLLDATFLEDGVVQPAQRAVYRRLHKAAAVVQRFELPTAEFAWVFGHESYAPWLDLDTLPVASTTDGATAIVEGLERLRLNRELRAEFRSADEHGARAVEAPTAEEAAEWLATHTTWNAADLTFAMTGLLGLTDGQALREPATLAVLRDVAALVRRTGVRAQTLASWLRPRPTPAIADALMAALKARYDDATWSRVITPVADRLRNVQRDALVAFILSRGDFADATALFDHLLVDPRMSACMLTSRVRLATTAVQRFIQRVLMNLEQDDVTFPPATAERWSWMKTYRVWEANRKVFFYPENWIEPELRDDKSPFFEQLEQHLQQGELTEAHVEAGYRAYLRKLHAVSHLEVPALCVESQGAHQVVHVLGRTRGLPPTYWIRRRIDDRVWTAWTEVPVDIPGNQVTLATHNRRLFILWLEVETSSSGPSDANDTSTPQVYQRVRVGWTEHRDGQWSPKKLSPLSTRRTDVDHEVLATELQIVAYERQGALYVDVLYDRSGLEQPILFRYDDCRDTLEEADPAWDYSYRYEDLGLTANGVFDGQRHRYRNTQFDTHVDLIRHDGGYGERAVLADVPDPYWLTTAKQAMVYSGSAPVVFDNAEHSFYIVPGHRWVEGGGPAPAASAAWVAMSEWAATANPPPSTPPSPLPSPSLRGVAPWSGTVPGAAGLAAADRLSAPSPGAAVAVGGFDTFVASENPCVEAHGVWVQTKSIHDAPEVAGSIVDKAIDPPEAEGVWVWSYRVDAFHHPYTCPLLSSLSREGIPGVLAPASGPLRRQSADAPVLGQDSAYQPLNVMPPHPREDFDFTPGGAYSVYNWELFVHAPLLIAQRLRKEQRFEEALRWLHFVFNPQRGVEPGEDDGPARFWNAKPLHRDLQGGPVDVVRAVMTEDGLDADPSLVKSFFDSVLAWMLDPFSPHAVARVRAGTYQKAIVRQYLDTILEWGDQLFVRDTRESVAEATQLYLLAASILGPRPRRLPATDVPVRTYDALMGPALFGGLTELEGLIPPKALALPWMSFEAVTSSQAEDAPAAGGAPPPSPLWWAFCLPANDQLLAYWDRVGDRLFKIRHCQNIDGVERALRLFDPPIDPALLVRAKAAGVDLGSALADLNAPLPHHRYAVLRGRAQELLGDVRALGGALLSALEKRDAEALATLRARHEVTLLEAVRDVRALNVKETSAQLQGLREQRSAVLARYEHYRSRKKISTLETQSLALSGTAASLQVAAQATGALAGLLQLIPEFKGGISGLGPELTVAFGGKNLGPATRIASDVLNIFVSMAQYGAQLTSTLAGYERRKEDWDFQASQAEAELPALDQQIVAAEIRVALAKLEQRNHDRQVAQAQEVEAFLRTKFTGEALYDWMTGQLSGLYFQSYQMAHDMARRAEAALGRELGRRDLAFIGPAYWDGLRKGLLAGERLALDLRRMEVAQLEHDRRELELTRRFSLRQLDAAALLELRETGSCEFVIPEVAFDLVHAGHYFRRMRSVNLSLPAVAGPHVSAGATLTLLEQTIRVDPSTQNLSDYPRRTGEEAPDVRFVNDAVPVPQSVATSGQPNDAGVFELGDRGERYLPFEGAGAISRWRVELPAVRQFDYRSIADLELEMRFTARSDGGLRAPAEAAVQAAVQGVFDATASTGLIAVLSATKDFATEWERLRRPAEGQAGDPLVIPIVPERFPYVARARGIEVDGIEMVWIGDPSAVSLDDPVALDVPGRPGLTVQFSTTEGLSRGVVAFSPVAPDDPTPSEPVVLDDTSGPWSLALPADAIVDPEAVHDLWILVRYHVTAVQE